MLVAYEGELRFYFIARSHPCISRTAPLQMYKWVILRRKTRSPFIIFVVMPVVLLLLEEAQNRFDWLTAVQPDPRKTKRFLFKFYPQTANYPKTLCENCVLSQNELPNRWNLHIV
jgi:hypothetical protein